MSDAGQILVVGNLSKTFPGTRALDAVTLDVRVGEVHGLLGQNGSGKSTLIKLLSGVYAPDSGAVVEIRGERVELPLGPGESRRRGVGFVHQDLALVPTLSILENLRTDGFLTGRGGRIRWREERRRAKQALAEVGLDVDPRQPVSTLNSAERAMLALARSLDEISHTEQALLVLDEPTAYLPRSDVNGLFKAIRDITARGCGVLFVSHRLDEVMEICDRVTVLRDGRSTGTVEVEKTSEAEIMRRIVGRELEALPPREGSQRREPVLELKGLGGRIFEAVDLELHRGEIVGLTGLVGMGHEELPYVLTGALPARAGSLVLEGRTIEPTPRLAARRGMVLLPAERATRSGIPAASLRENISLPKLGTYFQRGWLDQRGERSDCRRLIEEFDVRPPEPERPFATLSGGNQQKALLAKWLQLEPTVLILHEPSQGIDVGARVAIFKQLAAAAARGVSVLIVSSEAEDLVQLCDRVEVFKDGRIVAEFASEDITEDRIVEASYAQPQASGADA